MGDVARILFQLNEIKELRFELEINDHFSNDIEDEENHWYTAIKFYGNDKEHTENADMCEFLSSFEENCNGFESILPVKKCMIYGKEKKQMLILKYHLIKKCIQN